MRDEKKRAVTGKGNSPLSNSSISYFDACNVFV